MSSLRSILKNLEKCEGKTDHLLIEKAYKFAEKAHTSQKRLSGEPVIKHPLFVAEFLSKLCLDDVTISAALLHDVCEDTSYKISNIEDNFGSEITRLVSGVTKLKGIKQYGESRDIENLRKMFLVMAKDIRVVLIRLADRLNNLKTLNVFGPEKRKRIAKQTIEIYAPLAERLGIGELKGQLEDLSFPYFLPNEYKLMKNLVREKEKERKKYVQKVIVYLSKKIKGLKIEAEINGRAKHLYSLYKKLEKYNNDITKIYDLQAVRIIVPIVQDCYNILGLIHKEWKPLPGRIKDYIALPKPNGYRSLHTTVFALDGKIIEIQIKTKEMHQEAEWGIAAHWHYSEKKRDKSNNPSNQLKWVSQLADWRKELKNREEFTESLKIDVFQNRIFIFTPQGDVFDLPEEATPIDFAYHIHSEVGNSCVGAKADGKIIPLDYKLKNGSVIEIITSKKSKGPKRDWLSFVKTNIAQERIRNWFRKQNKGSNLEAGRKILENDLKKLGKKSLDKMPEDEIKKLIKEFNYKDIDSLLITIGEGNLTSSKVVKKLFSEEFLVKESKPRAVRIPFLRRVLKKPSVQIGGENGVKFKIASCCKPVIGKSIVGFVTRGKGVTVHNKDCSNIKKASKEQLINVSWGNKFQINQIPIEISAIDRIGLFKDIAGVASSLGINLISVSTSTPKNKEVIINVILEVNDVSQVMNFFRKIKGVKNILEAKRKP